MRRPRCPAGPCRSRKGGHGSFFATRAGSTLHILVMMLRLMSAAASLALAAAAKDRAGPAGYGSKPHVSPLTSIFRRLRLRSGRSSASAAQAKRACPSQIIQVVVDDLGWVRAPSAPPCAHARQTRLCPFFCLLWSVCRQPAPLLSLRCSLFGQKKLTGRDLAAQHNVGWHNKDMKTPNADALVKEGIQLDKSCAPNFRRALSPSRKSPASLSAAA